MTTKKSNGGEVHDLTVKILQRIQEGIGKLVSGQTEMRNELQSTNQRLDRIDNRLTNVLDYTLHRYEDHERRPSD